MRQVIVQTTVHVRGRVWCKEETRNLGYDVAEHQMQPFLNWSPNRSSLCLTLLYLYIVAQVDRIHGAIEWFTRALLDIAKAQLQWRWRCEWLVGKV